MDDAAMAASVNTNDDTADRYSILSQLEDYKNSEGEFRFMLCYPSYSAGLDGRYCNEWVQTTNPVTSTTVTGNDTV